ncbi:MAG: 50S ribosomal protein L17 [bacterium]
MRKRKSQSTGTKFSRKTDQRKALLRTLVNSLLTKEKITTTEAKAKATGRLAERLISHATKISLDDKSPKSLAQRVAKKRILMKYLPTRTVKKLEEVLGPRFKKRRGGYTRIIKKGRRSTDSAKIAIIELV